MKEIPANRARGFASLAIASLATLLGFALLALDWRSGEQFLRASYDSLHALAGEQDGALTEAPVVIVYLDLPSFLDSKQDPGQPWPRELHAQLLRALKAAGARAVVFDIVFGRAGAKPEADEDFAAAIREHGCVILAAEFNNKATVATDDEHERVRLGVIEPIYEPLARAAAGKGIASLAIDRDRGVRRFVAGFTDEPHPTLAWATATALAEPVTQSGGAMRAANQSWIRYYGPPLAIPHVRYSQALAPTDARDHFFRDKIVFIGSRPLVGVFNERQDEFGNPFDFWQNKELFMPGVEVHATEMLNLLRGDWLHRLSRRQETLLLLLAALFGGGLVWLRPIPAAVVAGAGMALALGLSLAGFAHNVWFPWLIVSAAQIPAALGGSILFNSLEWYRARKRFEAAQRVANAKIREQAALIDKAHDAILVRDLGGQILYANPSAEKLFGRRAPVPGAADSSAPVASESESATSSSRAAASGDGRAPEGDWSELFSTDPAAATAAAAAMRDGEWNGELKLQTRAGNLVTVASRWTLIRDEAGTPRELLVINSDVTEKKLLEQQFLRTQRMNTIGALAGGMAHDLNNALAPILMGAQLLRRKAGDEETRNLLGMMETSTHRGADMVRQVLLFARGRGGEFERLELGPVLKDLEKMVRETFPKSIAVENFFPSDLWPVHGNLTQLHQVLLNLCVNARDAMPGGGKLTFAADNVELSAKELAELRAGAPVSDPARSAGETQPDSSETGAPRPSPPPEKFVSLLVSDTGTGMPPEVKVKIFEPFFTTKGEGQGTGIGLATVLRIVKAHGGFLRVESAPGEGTSFEIFLPAAPEAPAPPAARDHELPRGHGELILLADDEQAIRTLTTSELTEFNYRVLAAADGAEALTLFQQHATEVRLLVTDSAMPVMGGAQLIAALRRSKPGLPVIVTSGEPTDLAGLKGVLPLPKPFTLEELLTAVKQSLG